MLTKKGNTVSGRAEDWGQPLQGSKARWDSEKACCGGPDGRRPSVLASKESSVLGKE